MRKSISYETISNLVQIMPADAISCEIKSSLRRGIRVLYISDICFEIIGYNEVLCSTFRRNEMKKELIARHIEFITNSKEIKSLELDNRLIYSIQRNFPSEIYIRRIQ